MEQLGRRKFLKLATMGTLGVISSAKALGRCTPFDFQGVRLCEVGLDSRISNRFADYQNYDQWCWAACLEMVFRYYGYDLSQEEIVRQAWGEMVNLPASPRLLLDSLNRDWIDDRGRYFSVYGDVFTANPVTAANDLLENQPLIIGTMGHAMVLTALTYYTNIYGQGEVVEATVRDPWPGRGGRRALSAREWYSTTFLARVRVV